MLNLVLFSVPPYWMSFTDFQKILEIESISLGEDFYDLEEIQLKKNDSFHITECGMQK